MASADTPDPRGQGKGPAASIGAGRRPGLPQGAGFYRFRLGAFECLSVHEGLFHVTPPVGPTLAPAASAGQFEAAFGRHFLPTDRAALPVNVLFVDTGRARVLIDAGTGPGLGPSLGKLAKNLAWAGILPDDVDTIVLSHVHPDHAWGILDAHGRLAFPNARNVVGETEWRFWTTDPVDLGALQATDEEKALGVARARHCLDAIRDRVSLARDGDEIAPGTRAIASPGHTPGHLSFLVESDADRLMYVGDIAHHAALQIAHPDWSTSYDTHPEVTVQTRRRLLGRLAAERMPAMGCHLPFPGLGHLRAEGDGYAWAPVPWDWGDEQDEP